MKLPFSTVEFFEVFKDYNTLVFPMQIIIFFLGFIATCLAFKPSEKSDKIVSLILSFFWLWMGVVYHLNFFTSINKGAYLFGGLFVLQGILFLIFGVIQNKFSFRFSADKYAITGIIMILFALFVYPLAGYFLGHIYPYSPTFGLPCPTTIFTFGLLLMNVKKCPMIILIIPFIWSVIGFSAAINFGVKEDMGLMISGLITLYMLSKRNRMLSA